MIYCSIDIETTGLNSDTCQILEIGVVVEDTSKKLRVGKLPTLRLLIDRNEITGQPYAINMNARIFRILAGAQDVKDSSERAKYRAKHNIVDEVLASGIIWEFLYNNGFGESYTVMTERGQTVASGIPYSDAVKMLGGSKQNQLVIPAGSKRQQLKVTVAGKNFASFDKKFLEKLPAFGSLIRIRQRILDPVTSYADFTNDDEAPNMDKCFERLGIKHVTAHDAVEDAIDVIRLLRPLYEHNRQLFFQP